MIGIVGFSNNPITELVSPQLITLEQPALEMGRKAGEILINEIENKNGMEHAADFKIETNLIIREST